SGKTDQQKSYTDQDKVYRSGISDKPPQSKPGDKQKESRPKDRSEPEKIEYTRTPEEEKIERQKVHHPPDGVGFKFNSSKLEPAAKKHLEKYFQQNKEALMDPNVTVKLEGHASRPGKELHNWGKSADRSNSVYDFFEKKGVRANIFPYGEGEDSAIKKGKPDNADYAEDRVVKIKIERPQKPEKEKPEKKKPEKPKTDVPEKYKKGYKHDRKHAEKKVDRNIWDIAKDTGIPKVRDPKWLANQMAKGFKEMINASDFVRYCKETTPWDKPADEKLWKVTPPMGIAGDLQNNQVFQRRINSFLKQGGYDQKKMYKEYLIHWIRKGAK
ncbi:MAG: OmpA family protein, partial [Anaerolineaceae bacterium]|nr:OmpA family protein [Anaerolineaceae bacterium]